MAGMHRILLDLRPLQSGYVGHGIGRYTQELTLALLALAREGGSDFPFHLKALVFREKPWPEALEPHREALPVGLFCPAWKRTWLWDQTVLGPRLALGSWDLFHSFAALGPLAANSVPLLGASHCVATVHDLHLLDTDAEPVLQAYRRTWRIRLQSLALPLYRGLLVDSLAVQNEILQHWPQAKQPHLLTPGIDHFSRTDNPAGVSTEPGKGSPPSPFVLAVGDSPNKGLAFAAAVIAEMQRQGMNLHLHIVGDAARARAQLGSLAQASFITVGPAGKDENLIRLYRDALALVFPSKKEGFGFPLLEAQALNCPVLALNREPMASLVFAPEHRLPASDIAAWTQALTRLQTDAPWRERVVTEGKDFADTFTWRRSAKNLVAYWQSILDSH